ncbi:MAG: 4-hydroxy-3-methylbut-2-enyl diphosphate reductase, partial [Cetobacterium sp.]
MEIIRAEKMGFCFGVKKAVEACYEVSKKSLLKKYILGMVVHNKDVVKDMEDIG